MFIVGKGMILRIRSVFPSSEKLCVLVESSNRLKITKRGSLIRQLRISFMHGIHTPKKYTVCFAKWFSNMFSHLYAQLSGLLRKVRLV